MNRHLLFTATLVALLAGCSGSDTTVSTPIAVTTADATTATTTAPAAEDAPASGVPTDLCATVPSLDSINAVLDEPVTIATGLPRGPGEAACEVTGDGVANVQFDVLTGVSDQAIREQAAELGATVTDLADPVGGFAYSGTAVMVIDGNAYSVQAITFDVITDPNTPEAIERSAGLLRQWLALLGLA